MPRFERVLSSTTVSAQTSAGNYKPPLLDLEFDNTLPRPPGPGTATPARRTEARPIHTLATDSPVARFERVLSSAIHGRLGAGYHWGSTGPNAFDCSGFVWSTFQAAGVKFDRESAHALWKRFAPATPAEESEFGTLVFFSGLRHIGIVADAGGFYHASRHHGVVYSPFDKYWLARIDGFRRVPLTDLQMFAANEKSGPGKKASDRSATNPGQAAFAR